MNFIQKLPIAAAAIGLMLLLSQSAFKSTTQYQLYPSINGIYQSTPVDPAMQNKPGGWTCMTDPGVCAAEFSSPPNSAHQTPDGSIYPGKLILLPNP